MIVTIVLGFIVLTLLDVPIAFSLAVAIAVGLITASEVPLFVVAHKMGTGLDSFVLLAIPLYILAGSLMETGGISVRLVTLARALVGWIRGGLAMVVVVVEYLFSGLSGSTAADVSAVGSMLIPSMSRSGYSREYSVSVVSAASAMGMMVPPCINMVVAGAIANVSVGALFVGGFIPAVVLAVSILVLIYFQALRNDWQADARLTLRQFISAWGGALIPLGMPVIIFGGILGGVVTPTEAGMLAVIYAAVVGLLVYRELKLRDLYRILLESAINSGVIGILVGIASVFAWLMAAEKVPDLMLNVMLGISSSPIVFIALSALVFMVVGAFLEGLPAIVVLLPTMYPILAKLGIHPIHYINVIIAAVGIGLFLPPIGLGLLIACSIAKIPVTSVSKTLAPFLLMLLVGLGIIALVPGLTLFLPRLAGLIR
jgi:C4-dicarboxylate transporter DctM subunit